jgi:hypothetical protein
MIAMAVAIMEIQRSGLMPNANPTISWELNGSRSVALAHNLRLTRRVVRREGIEPPTR